MTEGIETVKVLPACSSLSTVISPPMAFASSLLIGMPSPVPVIPLMFRFCSWLNVSKILPR